MAQKIMGDTTAAAGGLRHDLIMVAREGEDALDETEWESKSQTLYSQTQLYMKP